MRRVTYTIGTSTRTADEFLNLLKLHNIELLIDIRRFPTSRFEHFRKENLKTLLENNGIEYVYLGEKLGGYRRLKYIEYTKTEEFKQALIELENNLTRKNSAIMCAERFPWRCHRRFVSIELQKRGWDVLHIIDEKRIWKPAHPIGRSTRKLFG
ncbi:MAG TPA: DUF488 domain-containing protein [bacterium (Candidatus Stahlbacteria)]|nr:DUF488 domain-containing protein [Candidatus Stahlbacteria bacterium]